MFLMPSKLVSIHPYKNLWPKIDSSVFIADGARIIGDVKIEKGSSIWYNTTIRGDVNSIKIGKNCNIQDNSCLHVEHDIYPLSLEEGITIGHSVTLHGCKIEKFCLIGMGATIMNNATIGEESIIGAGAVVPENMVIPPRSLVVGLPAKIKKELSKSQIQNLHDSALRYVNYTKEYLKISTQVEIDYFKEIIVI